MPDSSSPVRVLFVCTGNVCRSPMAEALFRNLDDAGQFQVASAGISALPGQKASQHSIDALAEKKIKLDHFRSQALTTDLVDENDFIFVMTSSHRDVLTTIYPKAADKTFLVCEFAEINSRIGIDVIDPIGLDIGAYRQTRDLLEAALPTVKAFIEHTDPSLKQDPAEVPTVDVAMAADHGGFKLKNALLEYLKKEGHTCKDFGVHSEKSVDYPDFAKSVSEEVQSGAARFGLLVCTSGIGMSMAANKFPGIRAAFVHEPSEASKTREHNDANVLCLGSTATKITKAKSILKAFLKADFEGGRHQRRINKMQPPTSPIAELKKTDPDVFTAISDEEVRQNDNIELIASENFASPAVRAAQGSVLTNKYAEGYPGRRWYGGCENVDKVEQLAIDRAKELFKADHANVQPHSGAQANTAVYFAAIKPGDTILTMDLSHGGHLTHGHQANFSGALYSVVHYGVSEEDEKIDYDALEKKAKEVNPSMITAGASAYPRIIDFERMRKIADASGALLFVDMAHIAGLVAGGVHPSPIPHADFVTTTTHKSLRGPRGGLILCPEKHAKKIDSQVFPGVQGGPLMHVIAAKAVCLQEALANSFKDYQKQVVANAKALADSLKRHGYRLVSDGTDNHLMMVDLRPNKLNGKIAQETLDAAGITVNKNSIPFDTLSPMKGGGIRIGTPAATTRGMKEAEMKKIGDWIHKALENRKDEKALAAIRDEVRDVNARFPLP